VRRLVLLALAAGALLVAAGAIASPARAAGWCGSGELSSDRPDVVTGPQVHAIYVVPSDGTDRFAQVAGQMADDVASIDTWWRGQDPTRTPRFDLAAFPSCTGLDISFVRLSLPGAAFVGAGQAFPQLASTLAADGFDNSFKSYLVYYDGPSVEDGVCGTGAGKFDLGPGFAVVWLAGCPSIPVDSVAAHELLHSLGALPLGAPHACPNDSGHPCDNPLDVLYPEASGQPLSALFLDWNHDDYYAHSGNWIDIQDSLWLHRLDVPQVPLSLTVQGGGSVGTEEPGPVCSSACTTQWDQGSQVTLDPTPPAGKRFIHWSGACGKDYTCRLTLTQAQSATAVFGPQTIAVRATVAGRGKVVCTPSCSTHFSAGATLHLRAVAAKGWRFVRWSGACTGTRPLCSPKTDYSVAARATFARLPAAKKKR
jgi:hypothetical protein